MSSILYFMLLCGLAILQIGLIQYVIKTFEDHENEKPGEDEVWRMRAWKLLGFALVVGLTAMIPMLLAIIIKATITAYLWL